VSRAEIRRTGAARRVVRAGRQALGVAVTCARAVLRWWVAELGGMVPSAVAGGLFGQGTVLKIRLDGDLLQFDASPPVDVSAAALTASQMARAAAADAIILVLPASVVLRRLIDVPAAAARELASAVPFLLERHTPFLPGQARSACRIAGPAPTSGYVQVELAATAAAPLERALARLQELDVLVSAVHVEADDATPRLDFAHSGTRRPMRSWLGEPWRPLLAGAAAVLLAGPVLVAGVVHARWRGLDHALAGSNTHQQQREDLRAETARAAILAARARAPDAVETLARVTAALPDTGWLFSFDFTPQGLQLGGFSTDMPAAVARLQALPAVAKLEFRSPVIHDARADRDRFDILLRLQKAGDAQRISP